ncbi:hypothetical protein CPC08DRAFT_718619 [Agrocybe pediades]|nr:hypothetical protein CPC08DRAFT_718619 [Agrocybe pediades]
MSLGIFRLIRSCAVHLLNVQGKCDSTKGTYWYTPLQTGATMPSFKFASEDAFKLKLSTSHRLAGPDARCEGVHVLVMALPTSEQLIFLSAVPRLISRPATTFNLNIGESQDELGRELTHCCRWLDLKRLSRSKWGHDPTSGLLKPSSNPDLAEHRPVPPNIKSSWAFTIYGMSRWLEPLGAQVARSEPWSSGSARLTSEMMTEVDGAEPEPSRAEPRQHYCTPFSTGLPGLTYRLCGPA